MMFFPRLPATVRRLGLALATGLLLTACAQGGGELAYYWQSVSGHARLMAAAEPIDAWIARPGLAPALRERLLLAKRARAFAVRELHLPDNASYHRYADLHRASAVWNVVAAPPYSLQLHTWCFPVLGCVGYRGYFNPNDANAEAARLAATGLEVDVYGVPAYSTLGAMNWAGGDPLLNTFVHWPEGELARTIFHELAHQVAYADDDTTFNESFATAVERLGVMRWMERHASPQARAEYAALQARRQDFRALVLKTRRELEAVYAGALPDDVKRQRKAAVLAAMRGEYAALKGGRWGGFAGYDGWFERANNAAFGVQAAYHELVPAFERLFESSGGDFPRFYAQVQQLAALPKDQRRAKLVAPH